MTRESTEKVSPIGQILCSRSPLMGPHCVLEGVQTRGFRKKALGSGSPIVAMMQPTQSFMRNNLSSGNGVTSTVRCSLPDSKMRAVFVVIANVFRQQTLEMSLVYRNDVIRPSAALHPTLGNAILPRIFERHPQGIHLQ